MKTSYLKTFLTMAVIAICFQGCDLFSAAEDVKFDVVLPLDFAVNEQAEHPNGQDYMSVKTLKATDNADVAKYKDKIKDVKLNSISYVISGFASPNGSVTFTNGTMSTANAKLASAPSVNLASSTETELTDINTAGFDDFAKQIKDNKEVAITTAGRLSFTPVAFTIRANFHVTITAGALK